jgi:hypothetical protein
MSQNLSPLLRRYTLGFIGIVQLILGLVFIFFPNQFASMLGLPPMPAWGLWLLCMFGARAFAFAYGMFIAMSNPTKHTAWIRGMIMVQAIDWLATLYFLMNGSLTLMQVSTASFLPIIFILILFLTYPGEATPNTVSQSPQTSA